MKTPLQSCEMGIIGLGVMGKNLLLNMADHGFDVSGYDKDPNKVNDLQAGSNPNTIFSTHQIKPFMDSLRKPRAILLLVPAGPPVDEVIAELRPHLEPQDLVIDAGNSYFKDTDQRMQQLARQGFQFLGMGISGGEQGARFGPSIMPGGSKEAYERVQGVLQAIAAKVQGEPCVSYLGRGSAGHFVKMIHNGIEYGMMQLIAESYDLMVRGLGLSNEELRDVYFEWNQAELSSYLVEITSRIFDKVDEKTGDKIIDHILGVAEQKGTGLWTVQSAMALQVPAPTIDVAVFMRDLSTFVKERNMISGLYVRPIKGIYEHRESWIIALRHALYVGIMMVYAQGLSILSAASHAYEYDLDLQAILRIWRGGCIIRSGMLEDILLAFQKNNSLSHLLLDPVLASKIMVTQAYLRKIVVFATDLGIPIPALMSALGYFDAFRSAWMPTHLIQAQRDYFGSHRYERTDCEGIFHTEWEDK